MTQVPASSGRSGGSVVFEVVKLILALFLPPLAVLLEVGLGAQFWINIILTILGWVPGVIHAYVVILNRG